ncbi:MAG: hypothetical protein HOC70_14160 [Gammaproteobacteria bacterium]|jgi:hypothetical protein|nr:hypothetical protein [Gammaproteobacteria bacterium]MBT4494382.1 hypothetical protein [Gammaproteobacteria bacterium]MBT7371084.1 hypothetical protein [Gammaproteobacteria bacterium]
MDMVGMGIALIIGIGIGYAIATQIANKKADQKPAAKALPDWWNVRQGLTGTQLQILQYMEAKKEVSITGLHEKFSAIPDRELYYRLEQIVLMNFLVLERKEGEVVYVLNPDYSGTVEDDKTVMLSAD